MNAAFLTLLAIVAPFPIASAANDYYVFAIDTSSNMKGNRLTAVRQALMSFVLDATDKMYVGVATFAIQAEFCSYIRHLGRDSAKKSLLDSLPVKGSLTDLKGGQANVKAGITKSMELLKNLEKDDARKILVVITASPTTQHLPSVEDRTEVYSVVIGREATAGSNHLVTTSKMVFYESETPGEPYTVTEAFLKIAKKSAKKELHMSMFTLSPENSTWIGHVDIDRELGKDTVFYISWMAQDGGGGDGGKVSDVDFVVTTPNKRTLTRNDSKSSRYTSSSAFHMARFNIQGIAPPGRWTMKVSSVAASKISVTSSVLSRVVNSSQPMISIYPKVEMINDIATKDCKYIFISAIVERSFPKKPTRRVIGAKVVATVTRPNQPPKTVELDDNGAHSPPDYTKDDGIYVGIFVNFTNGTWYNFRITVTVKDDGEMPYTSNKKPPQHNHDIDLIRKEKTSSQTVTKTSLGPFKRIETMGMMAPKCQNSPMKPSHINNLKVIDVKCDVVTLTWTAPGANSFNGRASFYEVRTGSFKELDVNYSDAHIIPSSAVLAKSPSRMNKPLSAGEKETLIFRCDACRNMKIAAFRIRARNDAGRWSAPSNIRKGWVNNADCEEPTTSESVTTQAETTTELTKLPPSSPSTGYVSEKVEDLSTQPPSNERTSPLTESIQTETATSVLTSEPSSTMTPPHTETVEPASLIMTEGTPSNAQTPTIEPQTEKLTTQSHPDVTDKARPWWYFYLPEEVLHSTKTARPISCDCIVGKRKKLVCSQQLTFLGEVKSVNKTSLSVTLTKATIFSRRSPNGIKVDHDVHIVHRCINCNSLRPNRWYVLTVNFNPDDEKFYTDGKSIVQRISNGAIAKNRNRIVKNFQKCEQKTKSH